MYKSLDIDDKNKNKNPKKIAFPTEKLKQQQINLSHVKMSSKRNQEPKIKPIENALKIGKFT